MKEKSENKRNTTAIRFNQKLPGWLCPFCGKPVGYVGNFLAKIFGTRIHNCDFSNTTLDKDQQS